MIICRYNAHIKLQKFKILLLENNAHALPVGTLSAISINFAKG